MFSGLTLISYMALNLGLEISDEDGASEESKYLTKLFFMGPEPKN